MSKKKEVSYFAVVSVSVTALLAGFLLSFIYSSFEKDILANNEKTVLNGVKAVIEGADTIEGPITENSTYPYYVGKKSDGSIAGYAMLSSAGGYNGQIKVLVGFDSEVDKITGISIAEQAETPGLGAKVVEPAFKDQFMGKSATADLAAVKGIKAEDAKDTEIAAITAATISSVTVVTAVNSAKDEAVNLLKAK